MSNRVLDTFGTVAIRFESKEMNEMLTGGNEDDTGLATGDIYMRYICDICDN